MTEDELEKLLINNHLTFVHHDSLKMKIANGIAILLHRIVLKHRIKKLVTKNGRLLKRLSRGKS